MAWRNCCGAGAAKRWQVIMLVAGFQLQASISIAATAAPPPMLLASASLADMSLEELGNIEITSVSRRAERLSDAAASVFVITADDIRRSGATSLPEARRLAPNLEVAQVSASGYAISARGFNGGGGQSPNKLLVLIDGRSTYTPFFSGVFWDVQNVMLEDVERIEVVSGPGGTLWGVNAVNGVINVITRSAMDTHGGLVAAQTGSLGNEVAARKGGETEGGINYRLYAKYFDRDNTSTPNGTAKDDAWHLSQAGFRTDWTGGIDSFTVQGNVYSGDEGQPIPGILVTGAAIPLGSISLAGANLTAQWSRAFGDGSTFMLQSYYDRTQRTVRPQFAETLDIFDIQALHSLPRMGAHMVSYGANIRRSFDRVRNSIFVAFLPASIDQGWESLFVQDEIRLRENLALTLGARVESNDYTGNEFLPTARLAWKFSPDHLLWTAVSRTVRAPSRVDGDTFVPGNPPFLLGGGPQVRSEVANVVEIGYRGQPTRRLSWSATLFHAEYDHLHTQDYTPAGPAVVEFGNGMEGRAGGIETWGTFQVSPTWRLSAGLTGLTQDRQIKPGVVDTGNFVLTDGVDPKLMWRIRSSFDLPNQSELDVTLRHVGALSNPYIAAYTTLDFRYGWKPVRDLELALLGQNLLGPAHAEFAIPSSPAARSEFERSLALKATWTF